MPLSRHFYSVDEVHAALTYTSYRVEYQQTLFWCKELLSSGYVSETISTLFEAWLWQRGICHLSWFVHAWNTLKGDEVTEDVILLSAYQLSSCTKRDSSLWRILVSTVSMTDAPPDYITVKSCDLLNGLLSNDSKELYFMRALYQGKAVAAWWISRYMAEDRVWYLLSWFVETITVEHQTEYRTCLEAMQSYELLLGYRSAEYDVVMRCFAVISLCAYRGLKGFKELPSEIDARYHSTLDKWAAMEGRMARRVYSIPSACLYGIVRVPNGLYDVESGIVGCPFWDTALEDYSRGTVHGKIQWVSDDAMEAFYDTYFPDDIPDEWTKSEKEKSHSMIESSPCVVSLKKYAELYAPKVARLLWTKHGVMRDQADCCFANIVKEFIVLRALAEPLDLLPRKKKWKV